MSKQYEADDAIHERGGAMPRSGQVVELPPPAMLAASVRLEARGRSAPSGVVAMPSGFDVTDLRWQRAKAKLRKDEKDLPIRSIDNVLLCMRHHPGWLGICAYDSRRERKMFVSAPPFAEPTESYPREVVSNDKTRIAVWFAGQAELGWKYPPSREDIADALAEVCRGNAFDPVQVYLERLAWDGIDRLTRFGTTYLGAEDTPWHRAVCRKWLISAVARAMKPGCQADHVLVLEGSQGTGKSSALAALCRDAEWFGDTLPTPGSKDAWSYCIGPWIIEMAELASLKRAEVENIKAFITTRTPRYRKSHGEDEEDRPRRCVFAGSTNDATYLVDPTGNRRFWPVSCGKIEVEAIKRDRDQVWAQAVHEYKAGAIWHLTPEESALATVEQEARREDDPWASEIGNYIADKERVTQNDCLGHLGIEVARRDSFMFKRVVKVLTIFGWKRKKIGNPRVWMYCRPES